MTLARDWPVFTSQIYTVRSADTFAGSRESGAKRTAVTLAVWPVRFLPVVEVVEEQKGERYHDKHVLAT